MKSSLTRTLFFGGFVRPLVHLVIGLNIQNRKNLPKKGPALIIANHNSHLDTLVLMSLFPLKLLQLLRPVAAADYFLQGKLMTWFSTQIMGIIPIHRVRSNQASRDPLEGVSKALEAGEIVILYPEGTRGEAEKMQKFKSGIAKLAERHPEVPVYPIFLHGLGKSLPRGEAILVPFFCDVVMGESLYCRSDSKTFLQELEASVHNLAEKTKRLTWEEYQESVWSSQSHKTHS